MLPELTPAAVIAAAAEYADQHSFETVSLFAIARELRLDSDALHRVIPDRSTLLDGVQALAMCELADRIEAALVGTTGRDRVRAIAEAYRIYSVEKPGRWRSLLRPVSPATARNPDARRILRIMYEAMASCGVPEEDVVHASRMMAALVVGYIRLEAANIYALREPTAEATWERMVDVVDFVLRHWPAADPPA